MKSFNFANVKVKAEIQFKRHGVTFYIFKNLKIWNKLTAEIYNTEESYNVRCQQLCNPMEKINRKMYRESKPLSETTNILHLFQS